MEMLNERTERTRVSIVRILSITNNIIASVKMEKWISKTIGMKTTIKNVIKYILKAFIKLNLIERFI